VPPPSTTTTQSPNLPYLYYLRDADATKIFFKHAPHGCDAVRITLTRFPSALPPPTLYVYLFGWAPLRLSHLLLLSPFQPTKNS
jgi:hypothetical protein